MMTALECRQQSVIYMDQAMVEHGGIRTTLLALNRTCLTMADQIERLTELRKATGDAA